LKRQTAITYLGERRRVGTASDRNLPLLPKNGGKMFGCEKSNHAKQGKKTCQHKKKKPTGRGSNSGVLFAKWGGVLRLGFTILRKAG